LFENNGSDRAAFNEAAGIKINGLYSWQLPQKMLGVYFKKQYGSDHLDYQLFFDRERHLFEDFALRASGNDWSNTLFRDGLIQQACHRFNMDIDNMAFRPSVVYVNGAFLGIHNIREKVDQDYIVSNHHLDKDLFDLIENGDYVETGSIDAWNIFWSHTGRDLSVQANFDTLSHYMDVSNFTDLIVTELYSANSSIDHNTMAWKPKGSGLWRWILMDLDRGFYEYDEYPLSFYIGQTVWPLANMMKNTGYKKLLGTRLANHLYTTFNPIRMRQEIARHKQDIAAEMPHHIARWLGTTSSYGNAIPSYAYWESEVEDLNTFADGRPSFLFNDLESYGFAAPAVLTLRTIPADAGTWTFNNMRLSASDWYGYYPKNLPITLKVTEKAGYRFKGWINLTTQAIIPAKSEWKYLDNGSNQGSAWTKPDFDDSTWKTGKGLFGYGQSGLTTTVSYGSNSSQKYITTYFRKKCFLDEATKKSATLLLYLMRDDGAVVYVNGRKVWSSNMPVGEINYTTPASSTISSAAETAYLIARLDSSDFATGENTVAVEIHQYNQTSTDLTFDLQLTADIPIDQPIFSTEPFYSFSLADNLKLAAVFEKTGENILPDTIKQAMTLYKACSPYLANSQVVIAENATLTIEPGVEIWMAPEAGFLIHGSLQALGTENDSITFRLNPREDNAQSWGAICFINSQGTSHMNYVTVRDASQGPLPYHCVAAISCFKSTLELDHIRLTDIDSNPIAARYSSVRISNSLIHSDVLGDLINFKYGYGHVFNCRLTGNDFPDTDGIDYDGINGGTIRQVEICDFKGANSDAIDIGEEASAIQIDRAMIYNITDKGISVGQRSTVYVTNTTILNANQGVTAKDSSYAWIADATFYGVGTPLVSCEKNVGKAGGNLYAQKSILSNSYDQTLLCDARSTLHISNSLSDNDFLPENQSNVWDTPGFNRPGLFDLTNAFYHLGSTYVPVLPDPQPVISALFYNAQNDPARTEFIQLINPGEKTIHMAGYTLSKAITFTFPAGSQLRPNEKILVVKDSTLLSDKPIDLTVYNWTDGSLANEGESIRLSTDYGLTIDQVTYAPGSPWPDVRLGTDEQVLLLKSVELDNHWAENWTTASYDQLISTGTEQEKGHLPFNLYPNPTHGPVELIQRSGSQADHADIYSASGQLLMRIPLSASPSASFDVSRYAGQLLLVKVGPLTRKLIVLQP
jgi:hypothetical protein